MPMLCQVLDIIFSSSLEIATRMGLCQYLSEEMEKCILQLAHETAPKTKLLSHSENCLPVLRLACLCFLQDLPTAATPTTTHTKISQTHSSMLFRTHKSQSINLIPYKFNMMAMHKLPSA
jgi:hypothetical protein